MALGKDAILKHAGDTARKEVHVPEWADPSGDDVVLVRSMTSREFDVYSARVSRNSADDKEPDSKVTSTLVSRCVINSDGSKVFTEADVNQLAELSAGPVQKIAKAILDVSGLTDDSEKAIEGNSGAAQGGSSSSS